ncbi:MAG: transcription termination factor Rho [Deltaproteobacteria bacterium]|nr:transcription termination factor Rho [Deltaproteobacteria bacterium]
MVKDSEEGKSLDKMTVLELRDIAKTIPGVVGATAMKKEELLVIIKDYRGIKEEETVKRKEKKVGGKIVTVTDLKRKILKIREEKDAARAGKDRKTINVLRRRINRIKKHTRKLAQS